MSSKVFWLSSLDKFFNTFLEFWFSGHVKYFQELEKCILLTDVGCDHYSLIETFFNQ